MLPVVVRLLPLPILVCYEKRCGIKCQSGRKCNVSMLRCYKNVTPDGDADVARVVDLKLLVIIPLGRRGDKCIIVLLLFQI